MGRQSARIFFLGKDHKEIYFQGHYHDKMYLTDSEGNLNLVWEKIKEPVITFPEGVFAFVIIPNGNYTILVHGNVDIDWGDGETSHYDDAGVHRYCNHQYTTASRCTVQISGDMKGIKFDYWAQKREELSEVLTKFPETMSAVTDFRELFRGNVNLKRIPSGLFDNCPNAEDFGTAFMDCSGLESIPSGLFDNCPNVKTFNSVFSACGNLESIPSGLFDNFSNVTTFARAFDHCISLEGIPPGLFDNCPNVKTLNSVFSTCKNLKSIPSGLFDNCPDAHDFERAFESCTSLKNIPSSLFDNCHNVDSFEYAFYDCINVTGKVPELWKTHPATEHKYCFWRCEKAANYGDIPIGWVAY